MAFKTTLPFPSKDSEAGYHALINVARNSQRAVNPFVHRLRPGEIQDTRLMLKNPRDRLTAQSRQSGHFQNGVGLQLRRVRQVSRFWRPGRH